MAQLKEQISVLYDMELNNYMMNRAIERLSQQISKLGLSQRIYKPKRKEPEDSLFDCVIGYLIMFGVIVAVIGAVFGLIYGCIKYNNRSFSISKIFHIIGKIFEFGVYGGIAGLVVGIFYGIAKHANEKSKIDTQYQRDCRNYEIKLKNNALRIKQEQQQKVLLTRQLDTLRARLADSGDLLNQFYHAAEIDAQFRNLICMGYMQEYIRLGISNRLDGTNGLYYLIMQALRMDQIQDTLDNISYKLDTIIDHQRDIYNDLCSLNAKCDRILSETLRSTGLALKNKALLESIDNNTAIAAYAAERTNRELVFQSIMLADYC